MRGIQLYRVSLFVTRLRARFEKVVVVLRRLLVRFLLANFARRQGVVVRVEFESKGLKAGFHLIGSKVEIMRFQAVGQLHSTCTAPPGLRRLAPPTDAAKTREQKQPRGWFQS